MSSAAIFLHCTFAAPRRYIELQIKRFRPDCTSNLVLGLAFGTPKFYIVPYGKIKRELVNLSSNCDVKSGLSMVNLFK